jgi:peroxin-7
VLILLGYASGLIELRDFRNLKAPPLKSYESAHDYAIRKIKFSPHIPNLFGSVSYDMNTKLWHTSGALIDESKNHTEFAYGFDFDPKNPSRLADCGWDRRVMISEFEIPTRV